MEIKSSTNSEIGSSHWYRTLIAQHKDIGEFLLTKTPSEELLIVWAKQLYDTSNELLYGYDYINTLKNNKVVCKTCMGINQCSCEDTNPALP